MSDLVFWKARWSDEEWRAKQAEAQRDEARAQVAQLKAERDALLGYFVELKEARAQVAQLREAIQLHSECFIACEKCGHDTPCVTDDVCLALAATEPKP